MPRTNIKDLAKRLGVSTATVSRAFGSRGRISERTRQRILDKAEQLGYRANIHARRLPGGGAAATVGCFYPALIPGEPDYFVAEILLGIGETAAAHDLPLQIHPLPPDDAGPAWDRCRGMLLDGSLGGVIVYAGSPTAEGLAAMAERSKLPCVVIGGETTHRDRITYGREHGARLAGRRCRDTSRKHPAYVGGLDDATKRRGFKTGLGPLAKRLIVDHGGKSFADGAAAAARLLKKHPAVDAVFCANDVLAVGFIREAIRRGRRIPKELAVIGCDDVSFAQYYSPALTTIRFHEYEVGRAAVETLRRRMAGEKCPGVVIASELVVRESA